MQFRQLRTFVAVASTLSFTRAAAQVHLAQSSVTDQIQALEADLGVKLFDRSRRELKLTGAGQRLLEHATGLIDAAAIARTAVAEAAGRVTGRLAIGSLETLSARWMPALIVRFCREFPDIELSLGLAGSAGLRNSVRSGEFDVAFLFGPANAGPELASRKVGEDRLVVVMPAGHRLENASGIDMAALAQEALLVTEPGCIYRAMFDDAVAAAGVTQPRLAGTFGSISAILRIVEAGAGCALVPRMAAEDALAAGRIAAAPWPASGAAIPISMIWRRRRAIAPALRRFLAQVPDDPALVRPADVRHRHAARSR